MTKLCCIKALSSITAKKFRLIPNHLLYIPIWTDPLTGEKYKNWNAFLPNWRSLKTVGTKESRKQRFNCRKGFCFSASRSAFHRVGKAQNKAGWCVQALSKHSGRGAKQAAAGDTKAKSVWIRHCPIEGWCLLLFISGQEGQDVLSGVHHRPGKGWQFRAAGIWLCLLLALSFTD